MSEKNFKTVDQDEVLKNLRLFNQKILKDKDKNEGVIELSIHKSEDGRMSASSFIAVPRKNTYQAFELLLRQGVLMFDKGGVFKEFGLSTEEVMMELFFNFMRIISEKALVTDKLSELNESPQVRQFLQSHVQALISYGIVGSDGVSDIED